MRVSTTGQESPFLEITHRPFGEMISLTERTAAQLSGLLGPFAEASNPPVYTNWEWPVLTSLDLAERLKQLRYRLGAPS
jgi:hypothetical protein